MAGLITRTPLDDGDFLLRLAPANPAPLANPPRQEEVPPDAPRRRLFSALVDTIKRLDALRRVSVAEPGPSLFGDRIRGETLEGAG